MKQGRRDFVRAAAGLALIRAGWSRAARSSVIAETDVVIENFSAAGRSEGTVNVAKTVKSDAEWRSQLSALAYEVARRAGTETPFTGAYAGNHADGLYRCICCDTPLFDSRTKFESGTGWPSFDRARATGTVLERKERGFMSRTEILCARCGGHLGHVFPDGPTDTGQRYCVNSLSLTYQAEGGDDADRAQGVDA